MVFGFTVQARRHPQGRVNGKSFLGRIMKLSKANLVGLTTPGQQSEMKSILAGAWPPLKPLPVFKYETADYRATIDFDKKRGEWVCRKTSLPSNEVQELRGGLREITSALPHGEAETSSEAAEPQEQELDKDTYRRLQAIREWREKYENGARYFELRGFLTESQRSELDDSLRLSLTARQLQFTSKNVANVFDDLSIAGGRFAALIELAKRSKTNEGTVPQAQGEESAPEAEPVADEDRQTVEVDSRELERLTNLVSNVNDPPVQDQEPEEVRTEACEFPAVSIKNVFPEQDQPSMADRIAHTASQQFEIEGSEIVDADSASLVEPPQEEGHQVPAFSRLTTQVRGGQSFAEPVEGSSWRFLRLEMSPFQVNVFAILFLFAATAFTVGLTVGRGPVGKRLREAPKSLLATDAKPPALPDQPDQADESSSQAPGPLTASFEESAGAKKPPDDDAAASQEKAKESPRSPEDSAEARSTDADSSPPTESRPPVKPEVVKPEVSAERGAAIGPVARNVLPPAISKTVRPSSKLLRRPKAVRSMRTVPRTPAPYRVSHAIGSAPAPRPSTILVTVPSQESQPFRVSFPNRTIAATSSLAMTSQLSVLVSPEPGLTVPHKSARLEASELVSFVWPRYSEQRGRYGLAEIIRVRATVGQLGQVQEVKFLSGSASLLAATTEAIRQWRYTPTLLDKTPVQTQQDITIEFRPPQYSARLSTQHPSHN